MVSWPSACWDMGDHRSFQAILRKHSAHGRWGYRRIGRIRVIVKRCSGSKGAGKEIRASSGSGGQWYGLRHRRRFQHRPLPESKGAGWFPRHLPDKYQAIAGQPGGKPGSNQAKGADMLMMRYVQLDELERERKAA